MRLPASLVVLSSLVLLQVWVCCDRSAVAVRLFPGNSWAKEKAKIMKEEEIHTSLDERAPSYNSTEGVFVDSKRRVPSCPDPLHNRADILEIKRRKEGILGSIGFCD